MLNEFATHRLHRFILQNTIIRAPEVVKKKKHGTLRHSFHIYFTVAFLWTFLQMRHLLFIANYPRLPLLECHVVLPQLLIATQRGEISYSIIVALMSANFCRQDSDCGNCYMCVFCSNRLNPCQLARHDFIMPPPPHQPRCPHFFLAATCLDPSLNHLHGHLSFRQEFLGYE